MNSRVPDVPLLHDLDTWIRHILDGHYQGQHQGCGLPPFLPSSLPPFLPKSILIPALDQGHNSGYQVQQVPAPTSHYCKHLAGFPLAHPFKLIKLTSLPNPRCKMASKSSDAYMLNESSARSPLLLFFLIFFCF